jgi:hypothetical protein
MTEIKASALAIIILFSAGCADFFMNGPLHDSHLKIQKRQYKQALDRLTDAENSSNLTPELRAHIYWLRAHCYEELKQIPEVIKTYRSLVSALPETSYAFQAVERLKVLDPK